LYPPIRRDAAALRPDAFPPVLRLRKRIRDAILMRVEYQERPRRLSAPALHSSVADCRATGFGQLMFPTILRDNHGADSNDQK